MTTTITPSAGQNVGLLQLGPGAIGYGAIDWRRIVAAEALQEGIINSLGVDGGWKVTAGGALNVSIAASTGIGALVQGDNIAAQGLYYVAPHSAAITEANTAAHATLPRIDQVILEVLDATHDGGASNTVRTRIVDGTATAAATLDNRNGAAALPNNAIRLADVLIPAAAVTVLAANIRDRRPRARGAYERVLRNANASAGSDYTTSSGSLVDIDATNLARRYEFTGYPVRARLSGRWTHSAAANAIGIAFNDNAAGLDGATGRQFNGYSTSAGGDAGPLTVEWDWVPAAGSHLVKPQWLTSGATASILAAATQPLILVVEEILRPSGSNT